MILVEVKKRLSHFNLDVSLQIEDGAFVGLMGESGSGKTTLLRIVAGLEEAQGRIMVGDEVWLDGRRSLPPQRRSIGFVFQEYALFENMRVIDNLLYVRKDHSFARRLLEMVHMEPFANLYPSQLSGGQKQRVALARALMRRPKLLLLDEPFSALDATMRSKLQNDVKRIHEEFGTTTIMVSHQRSEVEQLADTAWSMKKGRLEKNILSFYEQLVLR